MKLYKLIDREIYTGEVLLYGVEQSVIHNCKDVTIPGMEVFFFLLGTIQMFHLQGYLIN
jgi:hypothetical protein